MDRMSLNTMAMNKIPYKEEQFTFKNVSVKEQADPVSLLDWLKEIQWLDFGNQSLHSQSGEGTHEIHFRLTGKALAYYPLLRGITASKQAPGVKLKVD